MRYVDPVAFERLLTDAGFAVDGIQTIEARWPVPSARWLAERLAFAPGLDAMLGAFGKDRSAIVEQFVTRLEADRGALELALDAVAHVAIGRKT